MIVGFVFIIFFVKVNFLLVIEFNIVCGILLRVWFIYFLVKFFDFYVVVVFFILMLVLNL